MNPQGNASFLGDLLLGILQENPIALFVIINKLSNFVFE